MVRKEEGKDYKASTTISNDRARKAVSIRTRESQENLKLAIGSVALLWADSQHRYSEVITPNRFYVHDNVKESSLLFQP